MPGRSRHGLHVVKDGDEPAPGSITPVLLDARGCASLSLQQRSVVLDIGGLLNADTAGRPRGLLT